MFVVQEDGSVLDKSGRVIFFGMNRFIKDIVEGDCCFICGQQRNAVPFNDEHVIPDWLLRRFNLHSEQIELPNEAGLRYGELKVPCCADCNSKMSEVFEKPISQLLSSGYKTVAEELKRSGPWLLFSWIALVFFKAHYKNKFLRYHLDRRKDDFPIAELHSWEELFHIHCIARAWYSCAVIHPEVLGTLLVMPAKVRSHLPRFDFADLTEATLVTLRVDDIAIFAVLNDSGASLAMMFEEIQARITGPLSPLQIREVAAKLAAINLQVVPRPEFSSQFSFLKETYEIEAVRPSEIDIPDWDPKILGKIMHKLTEPLLRPAPDYAEVIEAVKSGNFTFITTPDGKFNSESMELVE
jgi:hypothetical protein